MENLIQKNFLSRDYLNSPQFFDKAPSVHEGFTIFLFFFWLSIFLLFLMIQLWFFRITGLYSCIRWYGCIKKIITRWNCWKGKFAIISVLHFYTNKYNIFEFLAFTENPKVSFFERVHCNNGSSASVGLEIMGGARGETSTIPQNHSGHSKNSANTRGLLSRSLKRHFVP